MKFSLRSPLVISSHGRGKKSNLSVKKFIYSGVTIGSAIILILVLLQSVEGFNDEKGILKWNPYWFSNFRYSAPSSFYISPNRIGNPYKRLSDSVFPGSSGKGSSSLGGGVGIHKWSPVYFSGGSSPSSSLHSPSTYDSGAGYMFSSSRPRWSMSDYGGSRFLTRYYGGNSFIPGSRASIIDLAGSNDLSALLGDEMSTGLGLENDTVDVLDGEEGENGQGFSEHKNTKK